MTRGWTWLGTCSVLVLGGCLADDALFGPGGGSDGGSAGGGPSSASPQIPSNDYCGDVVVWEDAAIDAEEAVVDLVNEARVQGGSCAGTPFSPSPPLNHNGALRCAARVHSKDMNDREFFDHQNPDGLDPFERMERAGYRYWTAGENIAYNHSTPEAVVAGWLDSPGHCRNILSEDFTEIGVGYYAEPGGGPMWTQTFGAPQ